MHVQRMHGLLVLFVRWYGRDVTRLFHGLCVASLALLGCEGEKVETTSQDSSTLPDSSTTDTISTVDSTTVDSTTVDSTTVDSSVLDAVDSAVTDAGDCAVIPGNLVTDGDFSTGVGAWLPENCSTSIVTGRCGRKALRVYDASYYGRAHRDYEGVAYPKGTKMRLRAWFKKSTGASAEPPAVFVRTWYPNDAGTSDYDEWIASPGKLGDTWTLTERVFTLAHDQTAFSVFLASYYVTTDGGPATDEFEVADVSLVVE